MKLLRIFIIIILSYIVISLSLTRIIISDANRYKPELENLLVKNYNVQINIKNITGNWKGLYPSIKIFINNKNKYKGLKLPKEVVLDFNIYKSIFLFKPIINSVYVNNIYYESSYKKLISRIKSRSNNTIPNIQNIYVINSEFKIKDNQNIYHLKRTNINIVKNNIKLRAEIDNNKNILINVNNIDINDTSIINLDYQFQINGNFDYNLVNIFNKFDVEIKKSDLKITAKGGYRDKKFINNIITLETTNESSIIVNNRILNNLKFNIIFNQKSNNGLNFEISNLNFLSNNNPYNFKNIAGSFKNNIYSFYINDINFNYKNIISDFNIKFAYIKDFNLQGKVKNLHLSFNKDNFFKSIYLKGDFYNINVKYKNKKVSNFSGFIESDPDSIFVNFNSKNILLSDNNIFRKDRNFSSITGFLNILNYKSPTIKFRNLRLVNNEIDISFDGFVNKELNKIKLISSINSLDMRFVTDYMPSSFISYDSALWFSNSFKDGFTKDGNILIDGELSNYPYYDDYSGHSYGIFPISNLHIDYKEDWIPLKNITGDAHFSNANAKFISSNFKILKTDLTGGNLTISDVRNPELLLKGNLNGPLTDLLKYSNRAKLTNITNKKLTNIKGNSETNFMMKISFIGKENIHESEIKLKDIDYRFDDSKNIKSINGIIKYKDGKFYTEKNNFIKAKYINNDIKFRLTTNKNRDFVLSGKHYLNFKKIINNKVFEKNIIGKSLWKYTILVPGFNKKKNSIININAKSNLVGTKINYPLPFKKNISEKKFTVVDLVLEGSDFKSYKILYNGILAEFKSGNGLNGYINFSGNKSDVPKNKINIIGFLDKFNLNFWKEFNSNSDEIDYLSFLNYIDLSFGSFINNDIILDNFKINGYRSNNNTFVFKSLEVTSRYVNITASGVVEFDHNSNFKINLNSKNVEELLNYWKISHSLRESSIKGSSEISWKGGIFDFGLKKSYGKFTINMKDGRLKKVGNRATRIFGLFNFDLLVKRLSLDFDDVTKNGFFFNTMIGDFRLDDGSIYTTNLIVKGPSAELLTIGRTDIINETYDMQVVASPEFGEALPAIALLGGPITAAATFAAEKLAKAFGKDINDLIKIKYSVTGSWDEPIIKIIDKSVSPLENIEDLFK